MPFRYSSNRRGHKKDSELKNVLEKKIPSPNVRKKHLPGKHRMKNKSRLQSMISWKLFFFFFQITLCCLCTYLNIPCFITAKDFSQIKQAFIEYCLKHTWGCFVWMQPTSECDFGRGTDLEELPSKMMQRSLKPPVIFIAGRPKAALLFWFFSDFRCGALLFMVIHVIYKYTNR